MDICEHTHQILNSACDILDYEPVDDLTAKLVSSMLEEHLANTGIYKDNIESGIFTCIGGSKISGKTIVKDKDYYVKHCIFWVITFDKKVDIEIESSPYDCPWWEK